MNWWEAMIPGGLIVIGWVLTGRALIQLTQRISGLRERVAFLEAKVNGKGEE